MAKVIEKETADVDHLLSKLEISLRERVLKKALKRGAKIAEKEVKNRVPVGDRKHHPDKPSLRSSITTVMRQYKGGTFHAAIVGAKNPDGAHSHLVDEGHEVKVSRGSRKGMSPLSGSAIVPGKNFFAPAIDTTLNAQDKAIVDSIQSDIKREGG